MVQGLGLRGGSFGGRTLEMCVSLWDMLRRDAKTSRFTGEKMVGVTGERDAKSVGFAGEGRGHQPERDERVAARLVERHRYRPPVHLPLEPCPTHDTGSIAHLQKFQYTPHIDLNRNSCTWTLIHTRNRSDGHSAKWIAIAPPCTCRLSHFLLTTPRCVPKFL